MNEPASCEKRRRNRSVMAGAPSAIAQTEKPPAPKEPSVVKGVNPCAVKNPRAAENPCAAKNPVRGPGFTGSKGSSRVYVPGQDTYEGRLKSIESP